MVKIVSSHIFKEFDAEMTVHYLINKVYIGPNFISYMAFFVCLLLPNYILDSFHILV
jgi:hypothetical protein